MQRVIYLCHIVSFYRNTNCRNGRWKVSTAGHHVLFPVLRQYSAGSSIPPTEGNDTNISCDRRASWIMLHVLCCVELPLLPKARNSCAYFRDPRTRSRQETRHRGREISRLPCQGVQRDMGIPNAVQLVYLFILLWRIRWCTIRHVPVDTKSPI